MSVVLLGVETGAEEIWRPISGYENSYEISSFGRVRNKRNGRILKPYFNDKGYGGVNDMPSGWTSESYLNKRIYQLWYDIHRRCYDAEQQARNRGRKYKGGKRK